MLKKYGGAAYVFTVLDLLRPRLGIIFQNDLFACKWLEPGLCPKLSQDCISDIFTALELYLRVSAYCECTEDSTLYWNQAYQQGRNQLMRCPRFIHLLGSSLLL